ncbi:MAG: radical SAM protein [Methanosarcinales archaeon]
MDKVYFYKKGNYDNDEIKKIFKENRLLCEFDHIAERFIKEKRNKVKPEFRQLYLVITEACNFNCQYCRQITHGLKRNTFMNKKEAYEIIDQFFKLAENKPSGVVFYGGEPLLNKKVLLNSINYIRKKEKELKIKKLIDLTIITNGTNIDLQTAKALEKNEVYIIVSLDGRKKEHDKLRIYKNGRGTFTDVLKGYNIYKSAGCKVGISCTIGGHNCDDLISVFHYFTEKLKPVNVGINLPHDDYKNPLNEGLNFKHLYRNLFKIFERYTKKGLYIEHIMRKLNLLFKQEIKINDCPACGGRLVALPGKKMGICEGAIGIDRFFSKDIKESLKMASNWYFTSPLFDKKCSDCLALGLCGGGCPFDGYLQKEEVGRKDERRCFFIKKTVRWGLEHFCLANKEKIKKEGIFAPNKEEQNIFLKSIKATGNKLPLRSSANFSNMRI